MSNVVSILSAPSASTATPSTAAASVSDLGEGFKAALADASQRPADEKTEKVAGHHYEKIVAGPDKGHFINRTGSPRNGEDFQIVQRGGRSFHVWGPREGPKDYSVPP